MGKLVFGIIAVALLEVAFIGYAVIDGAGNATITEVRVLYEKGLDLARVDHIPEFVVVQEVAKLRSYSARAHLASARTRAYSAAYSKPRRPYRVNTMSTPFQATTTVIRTGPGIPTGYTMVLVDYLEGTPDKPKITYFTTRPKAKASLDYPAAPVYSADESDEQSEAR